MRIFTSFNMFKRIAYYYYYVIMLQHYYCNVNAMDHFKIGGK